MRPHRVARSLAALLVGLVFLSANTAPSLCALVHHSVPAGHAAMAHGMHGSDVGGHAVTAPASTGSHGLHCVDIGHCGIVVHGVTAQSPVMQLAPMGLASPVALSQLAPPRGAFDPLVPPPRA
jgi:hypothetical protein